MTNKFGMENPRIVGIYLFDAARGLVEQGGDAQGFGLVLQKYLAQVGEGQAGVEDVFDDEDILAFDGFVEVLDELDGAGGALSFAVAGDGDEVEGGVDLDRAGEVGEEDCGAFQHAYHHEFLVVQVAGNLRAHLRDAVWLSVDAYREPQVPGK